MSPRATIAAGSVAGALTAIVLIVAAIAFMPDPALQGDASGSPAPSGAPASDSPSGAPASDSPSGSAPATGSGERRTASAADGRFRLITWPEGG
ncbi:MAG: hypothetical protein HYX57_06475 [Chloroflexi bacterium]|nr:hypothetical protein [Chloroflexota bacterium]